MRPEKWFGAALIAALGVLVLVGWLFKHNLLALAASAAALGFVGLTGWWLRHEGATRQRAEAQLRDRNMELAQHIEERTAALRASEARYRHLVEVSPEGIFINRDNAIIFANPACLEIFGVPGERVLGRSPFDFIHPDFHGMVRKRIAKMLETGQPAPTLEEKILRPDGGERDVELTAAPFPESDGVSILVLMRDVTERNRLENRFLRAQRLESVGTLAGGIAHDLNNVLTPIVMAVKLLKKNRPEPERLALLEAAAASAQRGSEMIKQLLSFAGGGDIERTSLELKKVFNEVVSLLERTLPKNIALTFQAPDNLWPVTADATQISQVLMNLCVNARDAMPDGGALLLAAQNMMLDGNYTLTHPDAKRGPYVLITVQDTGTGIPQHHLEKIFDPFFTTKEAGKGTGLGLSTALGIIQAHGGFINVYSEENKGTSFSFYLPANEVVTAPAMAAQPEELCTGQGQCVLLVDDEQHILFTAKATLEAAGYRALTAPGGVEALALYKDRPGQIHAVVLDMMMPGMDGPAALRCLREADPNVRVIAASGLRAAGRVAEVLSLGAKAFLAKPYSDEQLLTALGKVLSSTES